MNNASFIAAYRARKNLPLNPPFSPGAQPSALNSQHQNIMTKSTRIKAPTLQSRDDFDRTVTRVLRLQSEIDVLNAREKRALQRVKEAFAEKRKPLEAEVKTESALAKLWAMENRGALLPTNAKCADAGSARVGFREGNPFTDTLSRWTVEKVTDAMRAKGLTAYLIISYAVAKAKVLADGKGGTLTNAQGEKVPLREVGLVIDQDETFYIEPKPVAGGAVKAGEAQAA